MRRERAARAGHHRERRAQVVRDRREQRVAQALALGRDARCLGGFRQPRALERERRSGPRRSRAGAAAPAAARAGGCVGRTASTPSVSRPARRAADTAPARPATCRSRSPPGGRDPPPTARPRDPRRGTSRRSARSRGYLQLAARRPASRTTRRHSNTSATCRTATRAMLAMPRVAASSRLIAYSSAVRRSRAPATRVCWRTLAISVRDHERDHAASRRT